MARFNSPHEKPTQVNKKHAISKYFIIFFREIIKWCCYCNNTIDTDLQEHKTLHKEEEFTCEFCLKPIKRFLFLNHLQKHSGDRIFECKICKETVHSQYYLNIHMKNMHTDLTENYQDLKGFDL